MENKRKHLEFIENVITRMAGNLFFLRGWTVTLIAALLALFMKSVNSENVIYLIILIFTFWILDGYFLVQERLFKDLYEKVRNTKEENIDFSMQTKKFKKYKKNSLVYAMFSPTLLIFYIPLIGIALAIVYSLN